MSSSKLFRKDEVDGKIVIEASGRALGKAKDVAFGLDGTVALIVLSDDSSEVQIPLDRVTGVAEYIVVKSDRPQARAMAAPASALAPPPPVPAAPQAAPPPAAMAGNHCRACGAALKPGAKFCTKCGTPA